MAFWGAPNLHGVRHFLEDKIITEVSGGSEAHGLAISRRLLPSVEVGQHWWTHENILWNRTDDARVDKSIRATIDPVALHILPQVFLATVADQREWSAPRADNGESIHGAARIRATHLGTGEGDPGQVPVSYHG